MAAPPAPVRGGPPPRLVAAAELPPLRWVASVALALLRRPSLVPVAVRQIVRLAPAGWWRRRPYVPVPPAAYLGFRSQTMYGEADRLPDPADVCAYLQWCREFPKGQG